MDGKDVVARWFITLVKIVYEFFNPHRVWMRQVAILHEPTDDRIGGRIHVHSERGQVIILGINKRVYSVMPGKGQVIGLIVHRSRATDGIES